MKVTGLEHVGESLITYRAGNETFCLGSLMDFGPERGVYDPTLGKVDVPPEAAKIHNAALDAAMLKGLDENCEVGQGGTCYLTKVPKQGLGSGGSAWKVTTWGGTLVSAMVAVTGRSIEFDRAGKVYRGRMQKDADCFNFRRVR